MTHIYPKPSLRFKDHLTREFETVVGTYQNLGDIRRAKCQYLYQILSQSEERDLKLEPVFKKTEYVQLPETRIIYWFTTNATNWRRFNHTIYNKDICWSN